MKKIFIALSVLAVMMFSAGSALAVGGATDNVPGTDFVMPFLVSVDRVAQLSGFSTLIDLSEVRGNTTDFHVYFYNQQSVLVHTNWLPITHWGSTLVDIGTYIIGMSDEERADLLITYNGVQYYAGYMYGQNYIWTLNPVAPFNLIRVRGTNNNVIGSMYLLDLTQGQAAASTLPMKEFYNASATDLTLTDYTLATHLWSATTPQLLRWAITGYSPTPVWTFPAPTFALAAGLPLTKTGFLGGEVNTMERWSPVALAAASNRVWNHQVAVNRMSATVAGADAAHPNPQQWDAPRATWFRLIPEYYINSASGDSTFILYQNGLANGTTFHFMVINNEENYVDTSITINEVTFIDARQTVPDSLKITYPYYGILNLTMDDSSATATDVMWAEYLGWNWQYDNSGGTSPNLNWSILKGMARDVGTVPGTMPVPNHVQP